MTNAPQNDAAHPCRILVVDDNPEIHRDFRKVLLPPAPRDGLAGAEAVLFGAVAENAPRTVFAIDVAGQGEEGLAMVRRALAEGRPYAAAFIDMRMPPGWDGLETVTRMMPEDRHLQLVICTAYSDYSWQELMRRTGPTDRLLILKKPFDPAEILQLAHAVTAKWGLARLAEGEHARLETAVAARTAELAAANAAQERSLIELRTVVEQRGRSEARFQAMFAAAAAAIAIVDARGVIWMWNPGAERLFGWMAGEAVGRRIGEMVPGLAGEGLRRVLALASDEGARPLEFAGRGRDGRALELEAGISGWNSPDGEFACCILQDIAARKRAESAIMRARDAAELAARAKSDFLAMMSHELRTPMNGVLGMTDLLLETRLDTEQREFASTVRDSAAVLLRLINEILDFSRLEAGRVEIERIDFDPRSALEDVVELLSVQARKKSLDLVLAVDAAVPHLVAGDPTRLKQIVTNLVGNALKFTKRGYVQMSLAPSGDASDALLLEVEDSGIGIEPAVASVLFEPFVQGDASLTRRFGGTGLGLAICRRLAGLMGGRIGFDTRPGHGSRFWCELPLPARPDPEDVPFAAPLEGRRVLCVDVLATRCEAMRRMLTGWGLRCDAVASATEACSAVESARSGGNAYAVVVIERHLGSDDGLDLCTHLRAAGGPPTLILARDTQPGLGAMVRAAGAAGFLPHPLERSCVRAAVRAVLAGEGGTGLITRHSLAERHRRRRPWVLLAGVAESVRRQVLARLSNLGCRVDVVADDRLLPICGLRSYDLVVCAELADAAELRAATPGTALAAWTDDGHRPAAFDAGLALPPVPAVFESAIVALLPALRHRSTEGDAEVDPVLAAIDLARLGREAQHRLTDLAHRLPGAASALMLAVARRDPAGMGDAAADLRAVSEAGGAVPMAALADEFARLAATGEVAGAAEIAGELHVALRHTLAAIERLRT